MSKEIKRILPSTVVKFCVIDENKQLSDYEQTFEGVKLNEKQALKEIKKVYGERVFVNNLEIEENMYFCSTGVFIANSRKVKINKD